MIASWTELKALSQQIIPTLETEALHANLSFTEAGFDSLDTFALFLKVEERYGVSIPESHVDGIKTFQDLMNYAMGVL